MTEPPGRAVAAARRTARKNISAAYSRLTARETASSLEPNESAQLIEQIAQQLRQNRFRRDGQPAIRHRRATETW